MTTLAETTLKLINEVFGLAAFEGEIREIIGNTNWEALALRTREARAALSRPIDPKAEVEALVKPSIDTMREAAWEVLRKNGWEATARLSLHQVSGLMAQFGMNVSAGEVGCGYPDCGCCDDAACEDAIKQHPDFAPALTPAEKAGVGDGVERLRKALEPFANAYSTAEKYGTEPTVHASYFEAARAALAAQGDDAQEGTR